MKAYLDDRQTLHDPHHFIRAGQIEQNPEQPERIKRLVQGAQAAGAEIVQPDDHGLAPVSRVHAPDYIEFLQTIHGRWVGMPGAGSEVIPNTHPRNRTDNRSLSPLGQAGRFQGDTACPIGADTWQSAYWSAQSAVSAAQALLNGERTGYALCRPPGHHAYADMAAGFCFLNNAAIAAEHLVRAGRRPAILDVDVHHGNGTQDIFYDRSDVLTLSIHIDPNELYPFFFGHGDELGNGAGAGCNLNLPLPRGAGDEAFLSALDRALTRAASWAADCIVIALGLDAHERDPFKALRVTTPGFRRIGARIARTGLPLIAVQEGGYLSDDLTLNIEAALTGLATGKET